MRLRIWLFVSAVGLGLAPQATAQRGGLPLYFVDIVPAKVVPAAFEAPYGRVLMSEFAAVLSDSADADCLKANGASKQKVSEQARAILLRRGTYQMEKLVGL